MFRNRGRVLVLRALSAAKEPLSLSELSQKTRLSKPALLKQLDALGGANLIDAKKKGNVLLLSLASTHISRMLIDLFQKEKKMETELRSLAVAKVRKKYGRKPTSIILFGSRARGDAKQDSDFDFMLVYEKTKPSSETIFAAGLPVSVFKLSKAEFEKRYKRGDALIRNIVRDGRIIKGEKEIGKML